MKKLDRILALVLCLVIAIFLLSACGGSSASAASATSGGSGGGSTGNGPAATNNPVTVNIMTYRSCDSLDRYATNSPFAGHAQFLWGDALIWIDEANTYHPWLAKSWEMSDDYLTWTFRLREDVYFQDGTQMTASDVAFTYDRNIDNPGGVNGPIVNYLIATEVVDDFTIKFHFSSMNPSCYEMLYGYSIINKAAYEANPEHYYDLPLGTGAYRITSFDPVTMRLSFEKNLDWWGWAELGSESNVDIINVSYIQEEATRVNALRSGDVQVIDGISPTNFGVLESSGFSYNAWDTAGMGMLMLNMNSDRSFHNDANLRAALSYCIDRASIVESINGGAGNAMDYSVQAGWDGYVASTDYYKYDPDHAAELMKGSKYDGKTLSMLYRTDKESELAQAIQAYASLIGISINLQLFDNNTYQEMLRGGSYDIALREWSGSCGENCKFYVEFLGEDLFNNGYGKLSPEFKELAMSLQNLMDAEEITKVRTELFAHMAENYTPHIYLYTQFLVCAYGSGISGIRYYPMLNVDYRNMTVN
jgi:ABC-type transport system substrate-binding protein